VDATKITEIQMVNSSEEISEKKKVFRPAFFHQIFPEEGFVEGFTEPSISINFAAGTLDCFVTFSFKELLGPKDKATPVMPLISSKLLQSQICGSLDQFDQKLKSNTFVPPGNKISEFTLQDVTYEIYHGNFSDDKFFNYHQRAQIFVLLFIDGSSYLDNDHKWEAYFLFKKTNISGKNVFEFVGYSTLYNFYHFPDKTRKRISQFLILPLYQRKGLGEKLLQRIYESCYINDVFDVTVEDPNMDFYRLRDAVDLTNISKHEFFNKNMKELSKDSVSKIIAQLKICEPQIKRLWDIFQYQILDSSNEKEMKPFRLNVKRKLAKKYEDVLSDFENIEDKKKGIAKDLQRKY